MKFAWGALNCDTLNSGLFNLHAFDFSFSLLSLTFISYASFQMVHFIWPIPIHKGFCMSICVFWILACMYFYSLHVKQGAVYSVYFGLWLWSMYK